MNIFNLVSVCQIKLNNEYPLREVLWMMKKGEKDGGSEEEIVSLQKQGFCKSSINPPASFLCFGTKFTIP